MHVERRFSTLFSALCLALIGLFAISFLPVMIQGQAVMIQGQGDDDNGKSHEGQIDGHLEGRNPVAGVVCVNYDGSFDGLENCDKKVERKRPSNDNQGGFGITVPKNHVRTATFTVAAGSDLANDLSDNDLNIGYDQIGDRKCRELPLDGSGMALCQNPEVDFTQRFNVYWTDRADEDGNHEREDGEEEEPNEEQ